MRSIIGKNYLEISPHNSLQYPSPPLFLLIRNFYPMKMIRSLPLALCLIVNCGQIASATELERAFVDKAKSATQYYTKEVEAAYQHFLKNTPKHCQEYEANNVLECMRRHQEDYLSSWKISQKIIFKPIAMTRVIAETYSCEGKGFDQYQYLLFTPEDSLVKKRVNALLEPLILTSENKEPDEYSDEGECLANETYEIQNIYYANDHYLGILHRGSTYFYRAAHPMHYGHSQHIDLKTGREIEPNSIFKRSKMPELLSECLVHLAKETEFELADYRQSYGVDVASNFSDPQFWAFSPFKARVEFPPYVAAAYAYGFISCEFAFEKIKPFLHDDFIEKILTH